MGAESASGREADMDDREWPAQLDDLVDRARKGPGDDWWSSAEAVLRTAPEEAMRELAVIGLVELVTQVHKVDRDRHEPCAGDELRRSLLRAAGFDDDAIERGESN